MTKWCTGRRGAAATWCWRPCDCAALQVPVSRLDWWIHLSTSRLLASQRDVIRRSSHGTPTTFASLLAAESAAELAPKRTVPHRALALGLAANMHTLRRHQGKRSQFTGRFVSNYATRRVARARRWTIGTVQTISAGPVVRAFSE